MQGQTGTVSVFLGAGSGGSKTGIQQREQIARPGSISARWFLEKLVVELILREVGSKSFKEQSLLGPGEAWACAQGGSERVSASSPVAGTRYPHVLHKRERMGSRFRD